MVEKKRKRIIEGKITLTTYRRFKKRFPNSVYNRKTKIYNVKTKEIKQTFLHKKPKKVIPQIRVRKQVVVNFRPSFDNTDDSIGGVGAISIRAITINPSITEKGLLIAVQETINELEDEFSFRSFEKRYLGFESVTIPSSEDIRLNDEKVHIEIQVNKNTPINYVK